jgi:hypothetical protein
MIRFFPGLLASSVILPWLVSALLAGGTIYAFGHLSKLSVV